MYAIAATRVICIGEMMRANGSLLAQTAMDNRMSARKAKNDYTPRQDSFDRSYPCGDLVGI
jgi:hypothetical protein